MVKISVIDPIAQSIDWVKHVLFEDFNIGKWFAIGFCAFLALLGENGGGGGGNFNNFSRFSNKNNKLSQIKNFLIEHILIISIGAGLIFVIIIAVSILIKWLSCRGKFMFLDNVVRNRAEVKELWRKFKNLANSLLVFEIVLMLASFAAFLLIILAGLLIAWSDIMAKNFGQNAVIAIAVVVVLFICLIIFFSVIKVLIKDFWVPIMYLRNVKILNAIEIFKTEFAAGHFFDIFKFFMMKILLGFGIIIISLICCCLTCCIIAIPYIGVVILLPLIMFSRCYSLYFMEQFGEDWQFFPQNQEIIEPENLTLE